MGMIIYSPLNKTYLTQGFGESRACALIDYKGDPYRPFRLINKVRGDCPPASRDFYNLIGLKGHNGLDLAAYHAQNLYFNVDAPTEWKAYIDIQSGGGKEINVFSTEPIDIDGKKQYVRFSYLHLKDFNITNGQIIKPGDLIGWADNTGASTGDHLHFGMKLVNELGVTLNYHNNYKGAVDPTPWYNDTFVCTALRQKEEVMQLVAIPSAILFILTFYIKKYGLKTIQGKR